MQITIYSTSACPRCEALKATLRAWERPFKSLPFDGQSIAEMRIDNFFCLAAPVLEIDGSWHSPDGFFNGNRLDEEKLRSIIA